MSVVSLPFTDVHFPPYSVHATCGHTGCGLIIDGCMEYIVGVWSNILILPAL